MSGRLVCLAALLFAAPPSLAQDPLRQAVDAPTRSARFAARDGARHPLEELAFFGVKPDQTVVEIWPGGGYWTEILAPLLHDHGTYYVAVAPAASDIGREDAHFTLSPALRAKFAGDPAVYGRIHLTALAHGHDDLAPAGSADVVLTFRNLHNWLAQGDAPEMLAAIHRALKPGGILGIEDHRASNSHPSDPRAADGYVREDDAIALVVHAGFAYAGASEIDANPRDTTIWPRGVWTLPPVLAMGQVDRAKYQAIGEADNFVLRFRRDSR